jgi:transketolase
MNVFIAVNHVPESTANVYSDALLALAKQSDKIVALEADLMACVKTERFQETYPERLINCGVQEADMIGVAAGLSAMGYIPYVHTFGCFASRRCYDQIFISAAYARLNIRIFGSDPGVYSSYNGGTHMPFEDAGIIRNIPNAVVMDLTDATMARDILLKTAELYGVYYMRYPRRTAIKIYEEGSDFTIGKGCILREGVDATVFASGLMVAKALEASDLLSKEGIQVTVVDMFTWKPIDRELIIACAEKTGAIVTSENHSIINGLGSAVAEVLSEDCFVPLVRHGVSETRFGEVGPQPYLEKAFGLTAEGIIASVRAAIGKKESRQIIRRKKGSA